MQDYSCFHTPKKSKVKVISETKYSWSFCLESYSLSKCYEGGGGRAEAGTRDCILLKGNGNSMFLICL